MKILFKRRRTKLIARLLLLVIVINIMQPFAAMALTSGPAQPEAQSFQPVGISDMVDLVSGDFKYNIPLLDVDGYPVNLNYQSGVGIDDEASWVGLGWNLNVGAINRQVRGIPDDFSGDSVVTEHSTKPKVTVGGKLTAKIEVGGKARLNGSFSVGIFSDNYTGIGAEIGANAGMSFSFANDGMFTAGMGIGVLSNTASGVDVTPNISLSVSDNKLTKTLNNASLSSSLGYNSRSGMKSLTLNSAYRTSSFSSPAISFNTEPIMPKIQIPYRSDYSSFSFDIGGAALIFFTGGGGTGYRSVRKVITEKMLHNGYGFLYAERGKNDKSAVMDFIREKENPIIPEIPNLALPIHTPDVFTYNSQAGSGQFRLYRGGTGAFFDNEAVDKSHVITAGFDLGLGAYFHGGVTLFNQSTSNSTRKWTGNNPYLNKGDFQDQATTDLNKQHVFFRKADEMNVEDADLAVKLHKNSLLSVSTSQKTANAAFRAENNFASNIVQIDNPITKNSRQPQSTMISYLTASEAAKGGLDKTINTYEFNTSGSFQPAVNNKPLKKDSSGRADNIRKKHHLSEITVNEQTGSRTVFGLPAYNLKQEEYSFALGANYNKKDGLASISAVENGKKGIDQYYHKDQQGAYAYSYMLTGILSPDYVDKTGNGITDDDNGTGIKFNYSKIGNYKWRTPYRNQALGNTAALNRGLLADPDDDKGSVVYGEKEIYYVHTIESKTKIAYFITQDRQDGLGVLNVNGDPDLNTRQKCLKEIRLYSKADVTKPIKVVKFEYSYELCPGTPNSVAGLEQSTGKSQGKLTLKKVWFEYGLTHKGSNHPYVFNYNNKVNNNIVEYASQATDRWGSFKPVSLNPGNASNEEYPYASQDKPKADEAASLWHIQNIELPSGGKINVNYEADDYAYVQNKEAMEMVPLELLGSSTLDGATGVKIPLSTPYVPRPGLSQTAWFKKVYLNGSDYMYTKAYVKVSTSNAPSLGKDNDFVPVYCKIADVRIVGNKAEVRFEAINEAGLSTNPMRFAAWQRIKNEYPRYAYPGFQNRVKDDSSGFEAAISAIVSAARNLSELKENFYKKAKRLGYGKDLDLTKSFVRVVKTSGVKIGGGARVQYISIVDNWKDFTKDNDDASTATYGQRYEYTTLRDGKKISSGVASYEPAVGSDENPLKQPVPYVQKIKGAINNYFELEEPFGESFYPAAAIAYSRVTIKDLDGSSKSENPKTGYVVNEFYTAKDFPVIVKVSPMQRYNPKPESHYSLVKTNSIEEMILSQGYSIETNDMHGRPKATRIFNQSGAEISSTEYTYQVEDPNAETLKLNNEVSVVDPDGSIHNKILGRDIEFFTDFREQETKNNGDAVNLGLDIIPFLFAPLPIPHWYISGNNEYKLFRSSCAVKVIKTTGLISKVTKTENGSSIAVDNIAYDGVTGQALVTRTQNEFKKYFYSVNLPAYWVYKNMGGSYQNLGVILKDVTLNANNEINQSYWQILREGDELVDLKNGSIYWAVDYTLQSGGSGLYSKMLIDREGNVIKNLPLSDLKVIRSGYRNVLSASTASMVSLNNPIASGKLMLYSSESLNDYKLLTASAITYSEDWANKLDCDLMKSKAPLVNNNHCFTFISGSQNAAYSSLGARYGNNQVLTSSYWGGVACESGQTLTRMAKKDTISASRSAKAAAVSSCAAPNMGGCTRDEDPEPNESYSCWPLNHAGIWLSINIPSNLDEWIGFEKELEVPRTGAYTFGFGSDNGMKVFIDDVEVGNLDITEGNSYRYWTLKPVDMTKGTHRLRVELLNRCVQGVNNDSNGGGGALEIYNEALSSLVTRNYSNSNPPPVIFSTRNVRGLTNLQTFRTLNGSRVWHYTNADGSPYDVINGSARRMNPFVQGYKGNWRTYEQKVFQENRSYSQNSDLTKKGIDVKNAGFLKTFNAFWTYSSATGWRENANQSKWITSNSVTLYDRYGQELENRDALNRYSAAIFDFNGQLPAAVASNAMNREIYVNSFEDFKFRKQTDPDCVGAEFASLNILSIDASTTAAQSHTGNYSLLLKNTEGIVLNTVIHNNVHKPATYLSKSAKGFALIDGKGLYPNGFEPRSNRNYIFNVWVKDGKPNNRSINMVVGIKGQALPKNVILKCKAIVEGWKLLEGTMILDQNFGNDLSIIIRSTQSEQIYIDDIRIHPAEAQMKSYAYSDKNFRLMAELDENALATFYEYDDEGGLVRVKKETERGIVTLKENRSSLKKR